MNAIFALLLLSLSVFAEECDDFRLVDDQLLHLGQRFAWNAASTANVSNAPCKTKSLPTSEAIGQSISKSGTTSDNVFGVELESESPDLIRAFRDLTTGRNYLGRISPQSPDSVQARFSINPSCKKVLCAVEKIWGPELGRKILYLKLNYDFNASELSVEGAKRFTVAELNDVLLALGDLPPHLKHLATPNQMLVRIQADPWDPEDRRTEANASVALFDSWARNSPVKRQYIVFHELSHNMSSRLGRLDSSREWLNLAGWRKLGQNWETDENHCQVSEYGSTDPDEDFAETASAYRYNAAELKRRCPERYDWMKARVFDNYEYLDSSCQQ